MSFVDLPPELLDIIFQPLANASLAALAKSCSSFTDVANRRLYRHLSLSSHTHNLSAVRTLAERPYLSSLVHSFAISLNDADVVLHGYYVMLAKVLQDMPELMSLELLISPEASWILEKATSTPYPRLQHFTTSFMLDGNVAAFLLRTPQLLSLQISSTFSSSDIVEIPSTAIPKLASYTGPASLLPTLFHSRPLTSLHLSGDLSLADIEHLAQGSRASSESVATRSDDNGCELGKPRVEVLSAVTSTPPVIVLEALAKACPSLVCLRVMTTCAFWEAPDLTFYTKIANTLTSLRQLSAFELSGMHWESRPKPITSVTHDGPIVEKEWISPPVTPRVVEEDLQHQAYDAEFAESFLEWAY
ncbi:unnamed protein product [Somion occarium]|uniref:F-box domain-containing protein n=1 Tax=Somion occarium TaxID=3059160 RepID=A0ABP1D5I0_9APHY